MRSKNCFKLEGIVKTFIAIICIFVFINTSCDIKRKQNEIIQNNNEYLEKWIYEDNEGQIIIVFYEDSNKGEWHIYSKNEFGIYNIYPMEYSSNEIILNSIYQKYKYLIKDDELTIDLIKVYYDFIPETYKFKKVIEENSPLFGTWQYTNNNGIIWEEIEFILEPLGSALLKNHWASVLNIDENSRNIPLESKISYTIEKHNIFGLIFDGLIIYPNYSSDYFNYYKVHGSNLLVIENPYRVKVFKKIK